MKSNIQILSSNISTHTKLELIYCVGSFTNSKDVRQSSNLCTRVMFFVWIVIHFACIAQRFVSVSCVRILSVTDDWTAESHLQDKSQKMSSLSLVELVLHFFVSKHYWPISDCHLYRSCKPIWWRVKSWSRVLWTFDSTEFLAKQSLYLCTLK